MDYVVGSVAALISGDVTPNRPKILRRALTPTKHQPSPNVTPKSEFVEDRSIFLSPTLQKKKAIVKKSPKRIFQNPDPDVTSENEGVITCSPKAQKVKKHLKEELDAEDSKAVSPKESKKRKSIEASPNKSKTIDQNLQMSNEKTPKKKARISLTEGLVSNEEGLVEKSPKKSKKRLSSQIDDENTPTEEATDVKIKNVHKKIKSEDVKNEASDESTENATAVQISPKKKNKKRKKKSKLNKPEIIKNEEIKEEAENKTPKKKKKNIVNPNAITDKDSDSEHESDNEIESENEQANNEVLDSAPAEESSDEEEVEKTEKPKMERGPASDDETKRTLFVGNVPFSKKVKKEMKKIFNKHGTIETIRIRTVPVKDQRFTPKMAVIKNELHPERSTVNVYIKFKDASSVDQALSENNTVLNEHHLRVSRSNVAEYDTQRSVFVGNLPFGLEDETLRAKFENCGEIESVRIIRDKKTNAGKGFGYVNFTSKDGVELALNLKEEDLTIKNRIIRVKRCTQTQQHGQKKREMSRGNSFSSGKNFNQGKSFHQSGNFNQRNNFNQSRKFNQGRDMSEGRNFQGKKFGGPNVKEEGAYRRVMNKRRYQEGGEGPPNKKGNFNQPNKEKKPRKEFVGMTAEKKKKHTFDKGQKKKKVLSEILTNK